MRKYRILITSLFLLLLAMGLYAEEDDQPRWNTTMYGSILTTGGIFFGFGGSLGYNLTSKVGLEGEVSFIFGDGFTHRLYIISGGVVLGNSNIKQKKLSPYFIGGVAYSRLSGEDGGGTIGMLGGGIKMPHKEKWMRFDLRFYFAGGGIAPKFSIGLMWTF